MALPRLGHTLARSKPGGWSSVALIPMLQVRRNALCLSPKLLHMFRLWIWGRSWTNMPRGRTTTCRSQEVATTWVGEEHNKRTSFRFFFSTIFFVMSFVGISWTVYWFLFGSQFWDWPIHCWMNPSVFVYLTTSNRGPTVQVLTVLGWFGFWHNNLERNSLPNLAQIIFSWCWTNEISIWPAMKLWVNEFQ